MRRFVALVLVALTACDSTSPEVAKITITGISPTSGPQSGGTTVTITGTNLPATNEIASVSFGSVPAASFNVLSSTQATVVTPAHAAGTSPVTVTLTAGGSATLPNAFTFIAPPLITAVSPDSGPTTGGTAVTVTGSGFSVGATLKFGGSVATGVSVTPSQITATSPAGPAGLTDVTVTNPDGQEAVSTGAFKFVVITAPTVTSLSRDAGSAAGGAKVRVNGAGFINGAVVSFGGTEATTTFISGTVLEAIAPAHANGQVAVTVSQSGVTSGTSANFEYLPAPTTTFASSDFESGSLSPFTSEIYGAGETVTISTDKAFSGTRAARCTAPMAGHQAEVNYTLADNRMLLEQNGVYVRFYIYIPDSTVTSTQGGQIKLQLVRSKNLAPNWLMSGVGSQFSGQHSRAFITMIDNGTVQIPGTYWSPFEFGDATGWVEVQYWYTRKNGTGRARGWFNGKLAFDVTDDRMGGDLDTSPETVRLGIVFQQSLAGSSVVYLDNVAIANGFIDP